MKLNWVLGTWRAPGTRPGRPLLCNGTLKRARRVRISGGGRGILIASIAPLGLGCRHGASWFGCEYCASVTFLRVDRLHRTPLPYGRGSVCEQAGAGNYAIRQRAGAAVRYE